MKVKTSGMLISLVLLAGLMIGCSRPSMEQRMEWMVNKISGELELTKDQQTAVNQMKDEFIQKVKAQKEARLQLRDEMIAMVKSDTIDPAKLETLKQKMKDLNQELMDTVSSKMIDFHKTMTPAQKTKAAEWMMKVSEHMMDMM